jgi:hypothetical protein
MTTPPTSPPQLFRPGTFDYGFDAPLQAISDPLRSSNSHLEVARGTEDFGFDDPLPPVNVVTQRGGEDFGFDDPLPLVNGVDQRVEEEDVSMDVTSPSEDPQLPEAQEFGINGASSSEVQTPESRS